MKVIYFDYWTQGMHNFTPIDGVLKAAGHSTLLCHLGSWNQPCPAEEVVGGIVCRDISFYKSHFVFDVLRQERPDAVLTLNARTLLDRALLKACRKLGIWTVNLAHGISITSENAESGVASFEMVTNKLKVILPKVRRYAYYYLPNYLYSTIRADGMRGLPRSLQVVLASALNPGRSVVIPPAIDEVTHDQHLVFSEKAAESLSKIGYPRDKIFAVGNPKYDSLLRRLHAGSFDVKSLPESVQKLVAGKHPYALVLEDAFPETASMGGWTPQYRNEWLREMARGLKNQGYSLVSKIHPGTKLESVERSADQGLIFQAADLDALIHFSAFCIAHISTTVDNCVLLDKPIVTPTWGLSKQIPAYFIDLEVSRAWSSPLEPPNLEVSGVARSRYKRERITVLEPVAAENVMKHLSI